MKKKHWIRITSHAIESQFFNLLNYKNFNLFQICFIYKIQMTIQA